MHQAMGLGCANVEVRMDATSRATRPWNVYLPCLLPSQNHGQMGLSTNRTMVRLPAKPLTDCVTSPRPPTSLCLEVGTCRRLAYQIASGDPAHRLYSWGLSGRC